jgi:carboxyl-terminal processing protease
MRCLLSIIVAGAMVFPSLRCAAQSRAISPVAKEYLEEALDIMQKNALHGERLDWPSLRNEAFEQAGNAELPVDTYDAIRWTLKRVNKHSFLQLSPELEKQEAERKSNGSEVKSAASTTKFQLASPFESRNNLEGKLLGVRVAYIAVPHFSPRDNADGIGFETHLQQAIAKLDRQHPLGWIVDLRGNDGGNMWPMLAGIGPLLGEGVCGAFHNSDGKNMQWFYRDGQAGYEGAENWSYPKVSDAPHRLRVNTRVAVLIDGGTASSGEAIAIAFRGKAQTRYFGQHTMGVSTNNTNFPLSDGANMILTVGVSADRYGNEYEDGLAPDVPVPSPKQMIPPEQDETVATAVRWLAEK